MTREQYRDSQVVGEWPHGVCRSPACAPGAHIHVYDGPQELQATVDTQALTPPELLCHCSVCDPEWAGVPEYDERGER